MTTKYITTLYANGYTLAPGYTALDIEASGIIQNGLTLTGGQPVSVLDDGVIEGASGSAGGDGHGGVGLSQAGVATLSGSGQIIGGSGYFSRGGGAGAALAAGASLTTAGTIIGGRGSAGFAGSPGGAGVVLGVGAALVNSGAVFGGGGGYGPVGGGAGGVGVYLASAAALVNTGTVAGGAGGGAASGLPGGLAGNGVDVSAGGTVLNGGAALISGNIGVSVSGAGTVINDGTIAGTGGTSVALTQADDRLVVEAGAVFEGSVVGGGGTLRLAGGSGTITGLGGAASISGALAINFSGFGVYDLGVGGSWTLAGGSTLSGGQRFVNNAGVTGTGTLSSNGKIFNTRHGVIDVTGGALTIDETGSRAITNLGLIEATGGSLVIEGPTLGGFGTIAAMGGDVTVQARVIGGGVARVDGGILAFEAKFQDTVAFTGAGGELALADSRAYRGTISGFSGGDSLDLGDIGYVGPQEATFSGKATGGVLTVSDGTHEARIHLAGDYLGATFTAASDATGGVVVVEDSPLAIPPPASPSPHAFVSAMAAMAPGHAAAGAFGNTPRDTMPALLAPQVQRA